MLNEVMRDETSQQVREFFTDHVTGRGRFRPSASAISRPACW